MADGITQGLRVRIKYASVRISGPKSTKAPKANNTNMRPATHSESIKFERTSMATNKLPNKPAASSRLADR